MTTRERTVATEPTILPSQASIEAFYSKIGLGTYDARVQFLQMRPVVKPLPVRIVISSTSNPF